jgi:hypothetical protein
LLNDFVIKIPHLHQYRFSEISIKIFEQHQEAENDIGLHSNLVTLQLEQFLVFPLFRFFLILGNASKVTPTNQGKLIILGINHKCHFT